ncbi:MAG: hypothetical protein J6U55_02145, partial [Bacteroidaceae bacterium]|nr:hypothetical protein [Bacteroidaceae bacterium]
IKMQYLSICGCVLKNTGFAVSQIHRNKLSHNSNTILFNLCKDMIFYEKEAGIKNNKNEDATN